MRFPVSLVHSWEMISLVQSVLRPFSFRVIRMHGISDFWFSRFIGSHVPVWQREGAKVGRCLVGEYNPPDSMQSAVGPTSGRCVGFLRESKLGLVWGGISHDRGAGSCSHWPSFRTRLNGLTPPPSLSPLSRYYSLSRRPTMNGAPLIPTFLE